MEIRQMEEKREESKEELTRLPGRICPVRRRIKADQPGKEQIEEAVKESEKKRSTAARNRSWDGRKNRKSRGRSWSSRTPVLKSCIWSLQIAGQKEEFAGAESQTYRKEIRKSKGRRKRDRAEKAGKSGCHCRKKKHRSGRLKAALQVRKTMDAIMAGSCRKLQAQKEEKSAAQKTFYKAGGAFRADRRSGQRKLPACIPAGKA